MAPIVYILLLCITRASCQNSLQSQAEQQLMSLLAPTPAKGEPWPNIPGPDPTDRVCIIGAGPAGIHMATGLKKKGYTNVELFEKSTRIGGKSFDINYQGTPHAQGTLYLEANSFREDNLVPLLREYGLDDLVPVSSSHIWMTNSASDIGGKLTPAQFMIRSVLEMTNSTSPEVNLKFYLASNVRYIKIHKEMFGSFEGSLMQRPSQEVMHRIRGTFLDFLKRENLLGMVSTFQYIQTLGGYGQLDEVGALYGLLLFNPRLVLTLALSAIGEDKEPFSWYSLKHGFENVWKTIAQKEELNIHFHADIVRIVRKKNNIYLDTWQNFKAKREVCSFLIWTPEASQLLRILEKPTQKEEHLLGSLKPEIIYAHLINMEGGVRHAPSTAYMANVLGKEEYAVAWTADTAGLLTPGIKSPEVMEEYNKNKGNRTVCALHTPSKHYTSESFLKKKMRDHFMKGFNVTSLEFINTVAWPFLPRWTPEEVVEGRHWDVFNLQGENKIWYAGASFSFETIVSVISYNNLLLKQMIPRSSFQSSSDSDRNNGLWPFFHSHKIVSTTKNEKNCQYSCTTGGGCKVEYRGYTLGSCGPGAGSCVGTPRKCKDCNTVVQCHQQ